jgi:hypothetical protein
MEDQGMLDKVLSALRGDVATAGQEGLLGKRAAYTAYAEATMAAGNQALTFEQWIAAGEPSQ